MHATLEYYAVQRFAPDPHQLYTIDEAAHLAQVPRHLILLCCRHGLIAPRVEPRFGAYLFDHAHLLVLQRIGTLHGECGINLTGIKIILGLIDEVDRLKSVLAARTRFE